MLMSAHHSHHFYNESGMKGQRLGACVFMQRNVAAAETLTLIAGISWKENRRVEGCRSEAAVTRRGSFSPRGVF